MTTQTQVTNPYSGQSTMLTDEEHKLYIEIKTAEMDEHYDVRRHYYHNVCTQEQRSLTESQYNDSTYTLNTGE